MRAIVDTNVLVVANANSSHVSLTCVADCVQTLGQIAPGGRLVLDNRWLILKEYMRKVPSKGQGGAGSEFLNWVLANRTNPEICEIVTITPNDLAETDFVELPHDSDLMAFDPSDRKFVAVACAHPQHPPILNATDTDWWHFKEALQAHGVTVEFLCEEGKKL